MVTDCGSGDFWKGYARPRCHARHLHVQRAGRRSVQARSMHVRGRPRGDVNDGKLNDRKGQRSEFHRSSQAVAEGGRHQPTDADASAVRSTTRTQPGERASSTSTLEDPEFAKCSAMLGSGVRPSRNQELGPVALPISNPSSVVLAGGSTSVTQVQQTHNSVSSKCCRVSEPGPILELRRSIRVLPRRSR
jgi:hypothetical protein